MIRTIAVLAAASFLIAALVTAKPATAKSYVSYSFGFGSYGHGYKYGHHGYGFGHQYGYPYRYDYRHNDFHGGHFSYYGSTYAKTSVRPAPAKHSTVVRAVGTVDPSLTFGYGNRARIDCKPTIGTSTVNRSRAIFGGTFCYDDYRRGYIVPGSQYFISYVD